MGFLEEQVDVITCGSCQRQFALDDILTFIRHKRFDCEDGNSPGSKQKILQCQSCPQKFKTPWSLLQHAQRVHSLQIYLEQSMYSEAMKGHQYHASITTSYNSSSTQLTPSLQTITEKENIGSSKQRIQNSNQVLPNISTLFPTNNSQDSRKQLQSVFPNLVSTTDQTCTMLLSKVAHKQLSSTNTAGFEEVESVSVQKESSTTAIDLKFFDECFDEVLRPTVNLDDENDQETCTDQCKNAKSLVEDPPTTCAPVLCPKVYGGICTVPNATCCSNQDCGITLMPVTHEKPKKCCSAVVPKKRKRHMVTKHLSRLGKKASNKGTKTKDDSLSGDNNEDQSAMGDDILIDFVNCLDDNKEENFQLSPYAHHITQEPTDLQSQSTATSSQNALDGKYGLDSFLQTNANANLDNTSTDLIQPGDMFQIPLSESQSDPTISAALTSTPNLSAADRNDIGHISKNILKTELSSPCSNLLTKNHTANGENVEQDENVPMESTASENRVTRTQLVTLLENREKDVGKVLDEKVQGRKRRYPTSKPYKCNQCDQAFNQRVHLKKHLSKHTGIKPYKCDQCDYSTVERSHLKVHMRVHTGEKPFRCPYCGYATAQNSTLKIHLKRHHGKNLDCKNIRQQDSRTNTDKRKITTGNEIENQGRKEK